MEKSPSESTGVGFAGLGAMGLPMAARLLQAGQRVVGFDRDAAACARFAALGGAVAESLTALGHSAARLITMLPDGKSVRESLRGTGGALHAARPGTLVIDMSSSDPIGTRTLGAELRAAGFRLIDAPVSGGVAKAGDGSLSIMVGGADADLAEARPLLQAMGQNIFHVGALGSGHAAKALNNFVSAAGLAALCEAFLVAEKFGIDPTRLTDVLNASTGKNNSSERKAKPFLIPQNYASGFAMALMAKDVETAHRMAQALAIEARDLERCAALWKEASAALGPGADHTAIMAYLRKRQGDVKD